MNTIQISYTPQERVFHELYLINLLSKKKYTDLFKAKQGINPMLRSITNTLSTAQMDALVQMIEEIQ